MPDLHWRAGAHIGIGNEVKDLLKMTAAHVSRRATASQVATVVGAAISIVRDTAVTTADFSTAEEHATATNARIITVDNLCGQPAAAAEHSVVVDDNDVEWQPCHCGRGSGHEQPGECSGDSHDGGWRWVAPLSRVAWSRLDPRTGSGTPPS